MGNFFTSKSRAMRQYKNFKIRMLSLGLLTIAAALLDCTILTWFFGLIVLGKALLYLNLGHLTTTNNLTLVCHGVSYYLLPKGVWYSLGEPNMVREIERISGYYERVDGTIFYFDTPMTDELAQLLIKVTEQHHQENLESKTLQDSLDIQMGHLRVAIRKNILLHYVINNPKNYTQATDYTTPVDIGMTLHKVTLNKTTILVTWSFTKPVKRKQTKV